VRRAALALALAALVLAGCADGGRSAASLFQEHCARCHGGDGRGDSRSVALYPGLDLTSSRMVMAGARGRGATYQRIADGYGAMPGFSGRLESAEITRLVEYVQRLPKAKGGR